MATRPSEETAVTGDQAGVPAAVPTDLISVSDFAPADAHSLLELTALIKARPQDFRAALAGKQIVLFFEKPSLRTRLTFEAGINALGGSSFFVDQTQVPLGKRESLSDLAHNVERWVDGVVLRTFSHDTISTIAAFASIPVINALSDYEHPCQAFADYFTLTERFGGLKDLKLAYVGDGNNVANSLLLAAATLGSRIAVATPAGYEPCPRIIEKATALAATTGGSVELVHDPAEAVAGAHAVYTDVWASMGQERETDVRKEVFRPYQVNRTLMALAHKDAIFMHCLPAHRGDEVAGDVMDSPCSVVFDQAENRLHVQKAIMLLLLGKGLRRIRPRSARA